MESRHSVQIRLRLLLSRFQVLPSVTWTGPGTVQQGSRTLASAVPWTLVAQSIPFSPLSRRIPPSSTSSAISCEIRSHSRPPPCHPGFWTKLHALSLQVTEYPAWCRHRPYLCTLKPPGQRKSNSPAYCHRRTHPNFVWQPHQPCNQQPSRFLG